MRLLHTSDWHLGQTFHSFERTREHELFLGWLLETLERERADALLVAGDVFDHANPSATSQRQFYRFLREARKRNPHLDIVLIAGNHDSPGRLEAPSPLLSAFDIRVVGQVGRGPEGRIDVERLRVPLRNRQGGIAAWCLAVPYLRPMDVPAVREEGHGPPDENETNAAPEPGRNFVQGVARLYARAAEAAEARREEGQALVALGHCHVAGGLVSAESERPILIGGAEALPAELFGAGLAYVALGHLHRAQAIAGDERVRYSGSPLPLSFGEIDYAHQIVRIDLDGEAAGEIAAIPVPRFVDLRRVPRQPAVLPDVLEALERLEAAALEPDLWPYLEVPVRLEAPEPGLRARIEAVLEGKPVRLTGIAVGYRAKEDAGPAPALSLEALARLRPEAIFRELYRKQYQGEVPGELLEAFGRLLHLSGETGEA